MIFNDKITFNIVPIPITEMMLYRCVNANYAFNENGNIIVVNGRHNLQIFDIEGNFIRAIENDAPFPPHEVAVASNGNILMTDIENNRICVKDRYGTFLFNITRLYKTK
jgi:hypothetical protein